MQVETEIKNQQMSQPGHQLIDLSIPSHLENFIGGNLIGPLSGRFMDNVNPATGEVFCQIPDSSEKDIEVSVMAARKAFPGWLACLRKPQEPFVR